MMLMVIFGWVSSGPPARWARPPRRAAAARRRSRGAAPARRARPPRAPWARARATRAPWPPPPAPAAQPFITHYTKSKLCRNTFLFDYLLSKSFQS